MSEHIRIGDVAPRVQYVADGAQTLFTYPFPIFDAADLEVRLDGLVQGTGYSVTGAGTSDGGSAVFATPPANGTTVTLRRHTAIQRVTDFQPNGVLRANTLNDELDYQVAALQEVAEALTGTVRADPGEVGGNFVLPPATARANRVLGFDSIGGVTVLDRSGALTAPYGGAIPRTVEDKLGETLSARDFGAVGDGVVDDGPALQAAMNAAAATGRLLQIGEGSFRSTMPLTLPGAAAGLSMRGQIVYAGAGGATALTLGDGGAVANRAKTYQGLRVVRATQADWLDERDIGIVVRNADNGFIEVRLVQGFTIGIRTLGVQRGFEDSTLTLGRIVNNRIGLDIRTGAASSWNNAVRYIGGHFANDSATNPTLDRFGVRLSRDPGGYNLHNHHVFYGPGFELQNQAGAVAAIPFLSEVNSRSVVASQIRIEGNSPQVARHTAGAQDHVYEVAFSSNGAITGTEGNAYLLEMDYPASATRAGGSIVPLHQAAAAIHSPKLIAAVPSLRAAAFRWNASETGFEGLAVLSSNPAGPPTTLTGLAFPGLSQFTLNANSITFPTSRALGFVVDSSACRDFFIAVEGSKLRSFAMLFDAAENLLGSNAVPLLSNQSMAWQPGPQWWQATADGEDATYTRLQRVTLPVAAKLAIVGVTSSDPTAVLKALRLYAPAIHAPQVLAGGGRAWGTRDLQASASYDWPSIAAGGTATFNVTLPNAVPGDFAQASFSLGTTLPFIAQIGATDTVTVRLNNPTGAAVDLAAGTVFVRALKPRA